MTADDLLKGLVEKAVAEVRPRLVAEIKAELLRELTPQKPSTDGDDPERRLSLQEAARLLGLKGDSTIRAAAQRGDLPCERPGGKVYRFRKADLLEWAKRKDAAPPERTKAEKMKASLARIPGLGR